ncbi:MAG: NUDIX domain-containing protein [Chthoniobacterales bacterium]|nr:NUDIX domain-containing protein [Chthoniobacterales bacterium]
MKRLTEYHGWVRRRGNVLLEQSHQRWRGLWILPRLLSRPLGSEPLHASEFPFTHHRITLEVFGVGEAPVAEESQRWFALDELAATPVPSPHRRALTALLGN